VVIGILVHPNQAWQGASVPSLDLFLGNLYYLLVHMSSRKELSSCAKRNKRKYRDALLESERGAVHKFHMTGNKCKWMH
jgi:hypothetical protein